jgi:uncharacterized repeat protein (TIGR03806 family)
MKSVRLFLFLVALTALTACQGNREFSDEDIEVPDFNFPSTVTFEQKLSTYEIFEDTPSDLIPTSDFYLLELSSILFTDYSYKQRLVKIPEGESITRVDDDILSFPNGTILTKTFFYYNDERDRSLGKRIIETRLLIKENDTWNAATYVWNEAQTDATLLLDGMNTEVSWINDDGKTLTTNYHVPDENECIACHQLDAAMTPLGSTARNLNRIVERSGENLNQLSHLQSAGVLNDFQVDSVSQMVDYNDLTESISDRGRAYLAMNCAHCHRPGAWDPATKLDFDFRHEISLDQTGIFYSEDKVVEAVSSGKMPFIGTTMLHEQGIDLVIEFVEDLKQEK